MFFTIPGLLQTCAFMLAGFVGGRAVLVIAKEQNFLMSGAVIIGMLISAMCAGIGATVGVEAAINYAGISGGIVATIASMPVVGIFWVVVMGIIWVFSCGIIQAVDRLFIGLTKRMDKIG